MPANTNCRHDHSLEGYTAALIQKLRIYFNNLSKIDQRHFVSAGERCSLDGERIRKGGGMGGVKMYTHWRLESPARLELALNTAALTHRPMPTPLHRECVTVCQGFLMWAVGKSRSWFNQRTVHNQSRQRDFVCADRVFQPAPVRRQEEDRMSAKTKYITDWLDGQKEEHLIMPNETTTILPYITKRQAHATFALDLERKLLFKHAAESVDLVYRIGCVLDDIESPAAAESQSNPDAEQAANALASTPHKLCRYGNIVMGLRSALPECPWVATISFFGNVWNNTKDKLYKKTVKLRKWMPFAKCDTCAQHRLLMAGTRCPDEHGKLKALQAEHLRRVKRERESYQLRQQLAILHPADYLSIIIDGADSSTYQLPHLAERSHESDACPKIKMHVLGCIVHGRDTYAFTCPPHIAQGHNITIQVLHDVLVNIKRTEGSIPPIINIQLDNTTKQNKGRYLMAYLGYLLQQGVTKEAYCNFLPVGHTHEDIDQFFSRVSVYNRHHNALDPASLRANIRKSFKKYGKSPIVAGWDAVANLSTFFAGYTDASMSTDITLYYQLRIMMGRSGDIAGIPIMQARTWPGAPARDTTDWWRGLTPNTSYVRVFKQSPRLVGNCAAVPPQQQPQHVGKNSFSSERLNYTTELSAQRYYIEKLMCKPVFGEAHKANMRRLMDDLSSNLDADNPVVFGWDAGDMDYIYGQGQYEVNDSSVLQNEPASQNIFDNSASVLRAIQKERPNGMKDPVAFQQAIDSGEINLLHVENVQACVLEVGAFYMQRPAVLDAKNPFEIVEVKKIILCEDDDKTQWGAWVHTPTLIHTHPHTHTRTPTYLHTHKYSHTGASMGNFYHRRRLRLLLSSLAC